MNLRPSDRETQYRPQAGKTLREVLRRFIAREFPRLGGPWLIQLFVDRVLQLVDQYQIDQDKLRPGQVLWPAIAVDECPGYRKPTVAMRQVPVVLTLADQDDVADLRQGVPWTTILQRALVRAAHDAYAQGGLLTTSDLSLLFHHGHSRVAELIRQYETATGRVVPRRGNLHDIGRTVTHKHIICYKAYVEGKPTHVIARETCHSPAAVDRYLLDFARVYCATMQYGMSPAETAFAIQRPQALVEEYLQLIQEFGLSAQQVAERSPVRLEKSDGRLVAVLEEAGAEDERREQEPQLG